MRQHVEDIRFCGSGIHHSLHTVAHHAHGTQADVLAHSLPVPFVQALGQMDLTDHGRQHMAVLQMEIVVRPVKVCRHHGDVVRPVLQVETLTHLQPRYLGDGIRLIGIFQRRREQHLFFHRLRSLTRINARAAQKEQLLHPVAETLADDVLLYLQVLVDEIRTILQIGHDASHVGGCQHHGVRLFFVEKSLHSRPVQQIQFPVRTAHQIGVASLLQVIPNGGTHQSVMSRHIYLSILVQHSRLILYPTELSSAVSSRTSCRAPP